MPTALTLTLSPRERGPDRSAACDFAIPCETASGFFSFLHRLDNISYSDMLIPVKCVLVVGCFR